MKLPFLNIHVVKSEIVSQAQQLKGTRRIIEFQKETINKKEKLLKAQTDSINYLHTQVEDLQSRNEVLARITVEDEKIYEQLMEQIAELNAEIEKHPEIIKAACLKRESFVRDVTNKIISGLLAENANLMLQISIHTGQSWGTTMESILTKKEKQWLRKIGA